MHHPRATARPTRVARLLDGAALVLALAWTSKWALGVWSWPLSLALHGWSLAGPFFLLGVVLALRRRRSAAALVHLALLIGWTSGQMPRLLRGATTADPTLPTFVSLNAGNGRARPGDLARWAGEQGADVLFLQELDGAQAAALERECGAAYPFRELHGDGLRGVGVLSRSPLSRTRCRELPDGSVALIGCVELEGRAVAFADVHLSAWVALVGALGRADESLDALLTEIGDAEVAVVAGDFNVTTESPLLGRLRRAGFANAFDRSGAGFGASFPEFLRYRGLPLPPVVRIDHVFVRGLEPRSAQFLPGAGADHRALRVQAERREE